MVINMSMIICSHKAFLNWNAVLSSLSWKKLSQHKFAISIARKVADNISSHCKPLVFFKLKVGTVFYIYILAWATFDTRENVISAKSCFSYGGLKTMSWEHCWKKMFPVNYLCHDYVQVEKGPAILSETCFSRLSHCASNISKVLSGKKGSVFVLQPGFKVGCMLKHSWDSVIKSKMWCIISCKFTYLLRLIHILISQETQVKIFLKKV